MNRTIRPTGDAEAGAVIGTPRAAVEESKSLPVEEEVAVKVFPSATFECVRCGSRFPCEELAKTPELTCSNCGYRIFRKVRGPVVKKMKGE